MSIAKKRTVKKLDAKKRTVKKLDPKQLFTVITVSRASIADCLNSAREETDSQVPEFTEDDSRLTDEVCQEIADTLYDAYEDDASVEEIYFSALEQLEEV